MALEIASAGAKIQWAVETTAGTKPSTGFTAIPNVKSIGALDTEPATYDVTDLSDLEFKRYIPGLKDIGGDVPLTFNLTQALLTAWAAMVTAANTAAAAGKSTWYEVVIPNLNESFFFKGIPSPLGLGEVPTDAALEITGHVTPNQIVGWDTKTGS